MKYHAAFSVRPRKKDKAGHQTKLFVAKMVARLIVILSHYQSITSSKHDLMMTLLNIEFFWDPRRLVWIKIFLRSVIIDKWDVKIFLFIPVLLIDIIVVRGWIHSGMRLNSSFLWQPWDNVAFYDANGAPSILDHSFPFVPSVIGLRRRTMFCSHMGRKQPGRDEVIAPGSRN